MSEALGSSNTRQDTITSKVNVEKICNIFLKNLSLIEKYKQEANDNYATELFEYLKNKKEFNFPINKHIELFILKNQKI